MSDLHPQTGPTSIEGKARSSQNALTFGFTSRKLIVGDERQQDYDALLDDLLIEFSPATTHARSLVEDAAHARWMLWRKQRAYNAVEAGIYDCEPDEAHWTEQIFQRISLADRYRTNAERAFKRAMTNVELLRRNAISEEQREARERQWQLRFNLSERSLKLREGKVAAGQRQEQAKADAAEHEKIYKGFDNPTLNQYVSVCVDDGETLTFKSSSNERLLAELEKPSGEYHYVQVNREYTFEDGILSEYHWTTDNKEHRKEKNHRMDQFCSAADFKAIVAEEATAPHCVLGPSIGQQSPANRVMRNMHPARTK